MQYVSEDTFELLGWVFIDSVIHLTWPSNMKDRVIQARLVWIHAISIFFFFLCDKKFSISKISCFGLTSSRHLLKKYLTSENVSEIKLTFLLSRLYPPLILNSCDGLQQPHDAEQHEVGVEDGWMLLNIFYTKIILTAR